jgi:hypothetical protein
VCHGNKNGFFNSQALILQKCWNRGKDRMIQTRNHWPSAIHDGEMALLNVGLPLNLEDVTTTSLVVKGVSKHMDCKSLLLCVKQHMRALCWYRDANRILRVK